MKDGSIKVVMLVKLSAIKEVIEEIGEAIAKEDGIVIKIVEDEYFEAFLEIKK